MSEKQIDEESFKRWLVSKKAAELEVINREDKVADVDGLIEVELELMGSTAIEDRL